ncbi:MAG TPA: hypothetical protein VFZ25_05010, partial [Chloroflexota bacterium]|nr:hypothetical protein [Chloroflexota bacterium]
AVRNCILGVFDASARQAVQRSPLYLFVLDLPLRAFYFLAILLQRAPGSGLVVSVGLAVISVLLLAIGVNWSTEIILVDGNLHATALLIFIVAPVLVLGAEFALLLWTGRRLAAQLEPAAARKPVVTGSKFWPRMFVFAALFNFVFGGPIWLAPAWSYAIAYLVPLPREPSLVLSFWSDFGFAVVLIGVGYYLVGRDVTQNRALVWLGIFAKLFDVLVLSFRFASGIARPLVLFPAAVDGGFVLLFVLFLYYHRASERLSDRPEILPGTPSVPRNA